MNKPFNYEKEQHKLFKMVVDRLQKAQTISEAQQSLDVLREVGEHGDVDALMLYGVALLMEEKPWYDAEKGKAALETAADADSPVAQYYLGMILLEGRRDIPADPITAKLLLEASANRGYPAATKIVEERWR
ncbi:MAG: hypothetical protein IKX60_03075 [Bacteroidales bacterium]|nr:hypothetical protein [Bacteroidales bacterium]